MKQRDYSKTWYHGSPFKLIVLRKGSTITQDCELARVFSHRPSLVSVSEKGIKHDGKTPGFLYQIAEDVGAEDIYLHPCSSMEEGKEWLTKRELKLKLISETRVVDEERLTRQDVDELKKLAQSRDKKA